MPEIEAEAERHFITLALQYHIAGRAAAARRLVPVAGNLLHHSIEMALKALLVADLKLEGVKKLGHGLTALWGSAIQKHPGLDSEARTTAIQQLDRFESLRYPDSILANGAAIRFGWNAPPPETPTTNVPFYELVMDYVDDLFYTIFLATQKNPQFFLPMLNEEAIETLRDRNKYPIG